MNSFMYFLGLYIYIVSDEGFLRNNLKNFWPFV